MTIEFDKRLVALAGCPVIGEKDEGSMIFNPHPIICASDDLVLAHEICHILGGKDDYDVFATAIEARKDTNTPIKLFKHILNMLYDWYHEYEHGKYSGLLWNKLTDLHEETNLDYDQTNALLDPLVEIGFLYTARNISPKSKQVEDVIDLVAWADKITEKLVQNGIDMGIALAFPGMGVDIGNIPGRPEIPGQAQRRSRLGAGSDIGSMPKRSNYYLKAVAKYWHIIEELTLMWKRNKYDWLNYYYGEINWKDLCGLFLGDKLQLPVFKLFLKIAMSRSIYLVIDRSGSTNGIQNIIMDTAIIIAESLRILNIPISILDVGVTNSVVNKITEDLDLGWFTPTFDGGTPLGKVCSLISGADLNSYLLIITDGRPDDWKPLLSALHSFPGNNLTFVIGDSYGAYNEKIKNAIHVEPHTIIREMLHDSTLD
jgi:hypothetical protein